MVTIKYYMIMQSTLMVLMSLAMGVIAGRVEAYSFLTGSFIATLNVLVFVFVVSRLFNKKPIALSIIVILLKYTFFGLFIYQIIESGYFKIVWFLIGLSVLFPSLAGFVYLHMKHIKNEEKKLNQYR